MTRPVLTLSCWLWTACLLLWAPSNSQAASYSSGSRSYSSHSSSSHSSSGGSHSYSSSSHSFSSGGSHSFSSGSGTTTRSSGGSSGGSSTHTYSSGSGGGSTRSFSPAHTGSSESSKSFNSGSGKNYSSGTAWSDESRKSYSSGKSYTSSTHTYSTATDRPASALPPRIDSGSKSFVSGSGRTFSSGSGNDPPKSPPVIAAQPKANQADSGFAFDTAAARARNEEASKRDFNQYKESKSPPPIASAPATPAAGSSSYRVQPPPVPASRPPAFVPDSGRMSTRPVRIYNVYNNYSTRPIVTYRDPYNSFFWWWLLDRSLDDRAYWAYHHRYDMDPARYQALAANDQQLEARVQQLEAQQVARDPNYTPAGLDRDLMYSDRYVTHTYSHRPTMAGAIGFWVLAVPTALAVCAFFIWLIWFKRWQPAT